MGFYLEVTEGADVGKRYKVFQGMRIGRTTGELILNDPKVSSLHAQVEKDQKNQYFLSDLGSSNGIRVRGKKINKLAIMHGVIFSLGKTSFRVVLDEIADEVPEDQEETQNNLDKNVEPETWQNVLQNDLPKLRGRNLEDGLGVKAFDPPLLLKFTAGIQMNTNFLITYGPRRAGADVLDLELLDAKAPPLAFEIVPVSNGAMINIKDDFVVLKNALSKSSVLKEGDTICVGDSIIEVRFAEVPL